MTTQTINDPLPTSNKPEIFPSSIAIWLAVQLIAIGLIIGRVKLWIHGGDDSDALSVMVTAQIAGASICAPMLMRNLPTSICVALSSVPFLQIAAIIAATDTPQLASAAGAVVMWMLSLAIATRFARTPLMRTTIHAIANCISIGGVAVFYLHAEFADSNSAPDLAWYGPIASALTLARRESSPTAIAHAWLSLAMVALIPFAITSLNRLFLIARARARVDTVAIAKRVQRESRR